MSDILDLLEAVRDLRLNTECADKLFKENCSNDDLKSQESVKKKKGKSQRSNLKTNQQQLNIEDLQKENRELKSQLEVIRNILDDTESFCANIIKHHTNTKENVVFKRWQRDALCLSRKVFHALHMSKIFPRREGGDVDNYDFGGDIFTKKKTKTPIVNLEKCFRPGSAYEDPSDSGANVNTYESLKAILDEQDRINQQSDKKPRKKRVRNRKNCDKEPLDNGSRDEKVLDKETNNKESRNKHDCPKEASALENRKEGVHGMAAGNNGAPGKGKPVKKTFGNRNLPDLGFFGTAPFSRTIFGNAPYRKERRFKGGRPIIYREEKDFPGDVCLSKSFKKTLKSRNEHIKTLIQPPHYNE